MKYYYILDGQKIVWYLDKELKQLPIGWSLLGKSEHPNPKMAVVSMVPKGSSGYTIRPYKFD